MVAKTVHFVLHRNTLSAQAPKVEGSKGPKTVQSPPAGSSRESIQTAGDLASPASLFPRQTTWIGAMVPKRWAKRAVTRNAIKRQIYTVSAGFAQQYPDAAFVVRLRRDFSRQQFVSATSTLLKEAVRHEVLALMQAGLQASQASSRAPAA